MGGRIKYKTSDEIEAMRRSGKVLAATLDYLESMAQPGITSGDLDRKAETFIRDHGGVPSFKGYNGFPGSICTSFNEQVVHGIPGERKLKAGDLLGIDCGVILDGYHSDMAKSFYIGGEPPPHIEKLMKATRNGLFKGIEQMRAGNKLGDISNAVQKEAESKGFSVVRALVGHGIGTEMHEEPQVPNFGQAGTGPILREGLTIAIEPMINVGTYKVKTLPDGWTVVTTDGKLSCHFEHTVAVTADGPEILTLP